MKEVTTLSSLNVLVHSTDGSFRVRQIRVSRFLYGGFAGRDDRAVHAHIEELRRIGVSAPAETPTLNPLPASLLTTGGIVEVLGQNTSGEVEYVLVFDGDEVLVGVGSDHTDRELEKQDIRLSKQVCSKVLAPVLWDYAAVEDHWDDLIIRSWVQGSGDPEPRLYQESSVAELLDVRAWMEVLRKRFGDRTDGVVLFSGTVPVLSGHLIFGESYVVGLEDPILRREIRYSYRVKFVGCDGR